MTESLHPLNRFELHAPHQALYESYYFRGTSSDGLISIWLKHNFLKAPSPDAPVWVENTFILFDESARTSRIFKSSSSLDWAAYQERILNSAQDWDHFTFEGENGPQFSIQPDRVRGRIASSSGQVAWDFRLHRSGESLFHFPRAWYYTGFFPKKKILTRDCNVRYEGSIEIDGQSKNFSLRGMNGHNWGKEHAHLYAYSNCLEWAGGRTAYFDGLSARVRIAGLVTPPLSLCALKTESGWHSFRSVASAPFHRVSALDARTWAVTFRGEKESLDVQIDGRDSTWVALEYGHPNGCISQVENTKRAHGVLRLLDASGNEIDRLESDRFELETLIPSRN